MATIPLSTAEFLEFAPPHRFSTADYLEMIDKRVLGPEDKVELIGGMIVEMSPQGTRHNRFLMKLSEVFVPLWNRAIVAVQATVVLADGSVFDPDCLLLQKDYETFKSQHPGAEHILLAVEAADSSLQRDQKIKMPIYAAAGIADYWIADLDRSLFIVHREPLANGYQSIEKYGGDDLISPLAAPDFSFRAGQVFE